jgi:hypothetical protein
VMRITNVKIAMLLVKLVKASHPQIALHVSTIPISLMSILMKVLVAYVQLFS